MDNEDVIGRTFMLGKAKSDGKLQYITDVTIMKDPDGEKVVAVWDDDEHIEDKPNRKCGPTNPEEIDRNARAYGWEVGKHGQLDPTVGLSPDNPFADPNWRDRVGGGDVGQ